MGKKTAKKSTSFLGTSSLTRPLFALGAASVLFGAGQAQALDAGTLPQNPNVVGGKDSFSQSGNTLNVNQKTNRTVIDWRSFDIGSKAQVNFNQPGSSSIAVNRVNGSTNPSDIEGGLHANGQVWILNPNGVFFGKGARVDAAGIVATTANINDKAFMAGSNKLNMTGADHGSVENQGRISVGANGLAAFVAPSVRNSGVINARVGRVTLAAGTTYTLDLAGDHMVELGLGSVHAVVDNSGKIVNPGGTIALTAKAAGQVVNSVVNVSGVVSASSVTKSGGTIVLGADTVNTTATAQVTADAGTNGTGGTISSVANKQGNYAGTFSAKGGSKAGDGGKIETSGHDVAFGSGVKVSASATKGKAGEWTVDPTDITIDGALAGTIESTLAGGTSMNVSTSAGTGGSGDITLTSSINAAGTGGADLTLFGRHLSATGGSLINISGAGSSLFLDVNAVDAMADTTGQSTNWVQDALGMIGNVQGGTTINLGAGIYAPNISINTANVTIAGTTGTEILVPNPSSDAIQINAIDVYANDVTIKGLEIAGPATTSYKTYAWGNRVTRGIFIHNGVTNFAITDNNIHGLRNDILIDGRNTGSITGNTIDNSKSGISVQYTDAGVGNSEGYTVNITGNTQGPFGNEWGINTHLNGHYVGTPTNLVGNAVKIATNATSAVQQALLAFKANNGGMTAQDQGYAQSNRTDVTVSTLGSDANQGSVLSTLGTVQGGINAVVAGGTVNVLNGTYVVPSGGANYLSIGKSLNLIGQSESGVIIDARGASSYGLRIIGGTDGVTLENFTLWGVTAAGGYGVKAEDTTNLSISNVTSQGAYKAQFDLNGVRTGTLDNVIANGEGVQGGTGSTKGAAIAITDSQDILVENSSIIGGSFGGIGIYQSNKAGGYTYQAKNITIADSNTFAADGATNYNYVYTEDESATNNFGAVNVAGFDYAVFDKANAADVYTFFQKTQQGAVDFAVADNALADYVQGWTGTAGNNIFTVGTSTAPSHGAMSITAAVNAALTGATINVLDGTYTVPSGGANYIDITKSLSIVGQSEAGTIIDARSASSYGMRVQADNVSLSNFTLLGSTGTGGYGIKVEPLEGAVVNATDRIHNFSISNVTEKGSNKNGLDLNGVVNATIANVDVLNTVAGTGIAITDSANVTLTHDTTTNNAWGGLALYQHNATYDQQVNNISVDGTNTFNESTPIYMEDESASQDFGSVTIGGGYNFVARAQVALNDSYLWFQKTQQAAIDYAAAVDTSAHAGISAVEGWTGTAVNNLFTVGTSTGGKALSIQAAVNYATTGAEIDVLAGNYQGQVVINKSLTLEGAGQGATTISAPDTLSHSFTAGGNPYKAVISIEGGANVSVSALTVDGRGVGDANNRLLGIGIYDSSATIDGVTVTRVRSGGLNGTLNGVQAGTGIEAYNDGITTQTVTVKNSTIKDFQKNGIAFVGKGITAVATNNTITGAGSTGGIAQNGIEIWGTLGSITGTVTGNTVSGINYTGNDNAATDIILINANGTTVSGNTITGTGAGDSSNGIYVSGSTGVNLVANTITKTGFGIDVDNGFGAANVTIQNNFVNNNGVAVQVGYDETDTSVVNAYNNDFSGNTKAVELESSSDTANFSGNWWGSTDASAISGMMTGADASLVDFSPFLMSGTDNNRVDGFQGNFNNLGVTALGGGDAARIQEGISDVTAGGTVNVAAGNYTLAGELDITKSLSLIGAGAATNITSLSTGYGINVTADNVSLKNFTFNAPTAHTNSTYGIKVTPDTNVASDRLLNFDIENVTINGGWRTGLDLNGVVGATIKNVSVSNVQNGNGVALTDSANVTLTNVTTTNNAWGGLALYQHNSFYDQQLNNINVDTSNHFNEANGIYLEDESDGVADSHGASVANLDAGLLNIAGYSFVDVDKSDTADQYTFFQKTRSAAVNFATNGTLNSGHLSLANVYVEGWNGTGLNNIFTVGTGVDGSMSIATANNAASNGATINILAGNYTLANTLALTKSVSLVGAGEGLTTIDASGVSSYAMRIKTDNVSLSGFTLESSTTAAGLGVISVFSQTSGVVHNASISHVTIENNAAGAAGVAITNAAGVTLDHLTVDGTGVGGNGVQIVDSANIALTNVTTQNNQVGVYIRQDDQFTQQTTGISADTTNSFTDAGAVRIEDASATDRMGALNIQGFAYAISSPDGSSGVNFLELDNGLQSTIDRAVALDAANSAVEGWTGSGIDNIFEVGVSTGGTALSINTAVNLATAGGTINVGNGTYAEAVTDAKQLAFNFDDATVNSFTLASGAAGSSLSGDLTATGAIALNGAVTLTGDTSLDAGGNVTVVSVTGANHDLSLGGASNSLGNVAGVDALTVSGPATLTGTSYAANSASFGAVSLTGDTTVDAGAITVASVTGAGNDLTLDGAASLGNVAGVGALAVTGASTLTGTSYVAGSMGFGGAVTLTGDTTLDASGAVTLASVNGGSNDLTIDAGTTSLGNVANVGALAVDGAATLTGTSYVADSMAFDAVKLANSVALNTSGDNGAIVIASIDGSSAGGQALNINAGKGSVSLGKVGANTRLGAVTDASATKLTGATYNANSFLFGGDVTLTAATTTLNTTQSSSAAGDITFQGDIFGTTDGGQSLTLIAGSGTGAASANGDITLQNAGTTAVELNNMTVSGDDFTALTVDLAGNYKAVLTGNQVFAADTLNVKGDANSTVGGNASGHVVAGGDVSFAAKGDVSGTISGTNVTLSGDNVNSTVTASNGATVTGNTVQGSYTADNVSLTATNNVNAAVNATDFTLSAPNGSVDGSWTNLDASGSGIVDVNGQPVVGQANFNPNQLVVEGFVLPAGTVITATGELILPQGTLLGLLSPGGGKPKMILVHTVQQLGELLAGGYSVIVIDLSGKEKGKLVQLASN